MQSNDASMHRTHDDGSLLKIQDYTADVLMSERLRVTVNQTSMCCELKHVAFCAGGRSYWATLRLNCGCEDLAISSSMQQICCTVQKTMSEVSPVGAPLSLAGQICGSSLSSLFPVITSSPSSLHYSFDTLYFSGGSCLLCAT